MSDQSNKIKGVRATVIAANHRTGWVKARVTHRATNRSGMTATESETISIMPKFGFGFGRGDNIRCIVVPPKRGGSEDWFAIAAQPYVPRESQVSWAPWQDGKQNLVQTIPDTAPGSDHDGIGFACWHCGNDIVSSEHIHRIKSTAVWTNTAELSGIIIDENIRHNKWKRCDIQNVRCRYCERDFGTYYKEPYYDSDTERIISETKQVFPCIKVTSNREMKFGENEKPDVVAVLTGNDMGLVRDAIARLQPSAEWDDVKDFATGGRVDADVHRMRKQAMLARDRESAADAAAAEADARARQEALRAAAATRQAAAQAEAAAEADMCRREEARRAERAAAETAAVADQLASVQLGCGNLIWECEIDNGSWSPFSKDISAQFERANRAHGMGGAAQLEFTRNGIGYRADFERMTQCRVDTGMERLIRRWQRAEEVASTISCRDELRTAPRALGLPDVNHIIRQIDRRLADIGVGPGDAEYDHRFAFFLYSMDDGACYKTFNDALRDRSGPRFDAWSPIRWHLNQALAAQPDVATHVLRGMRAPNLAEYKTETKIHWSGFSSSTTIPAVARRFAGDAGVIFKLKVQNAKDIRPFSWFGGAEGELLLSPNMEFVVTKERHTPREGPLRGCHVIEMQQIPDATLWS